MEFNSLSKTYNMAGWRIGYAVGNPEAPELLQRINSNVDSGWFWPLQYAAVAALGTDEAWIEERNAIYWEWHGILVHALTAVGFVAASPPATPYLQTRISDGEAAEPFALRLLQGTGIAVAPRRSSVWMVRDSCLSQRLLGSSGADPGVEDVCQKAPATRVARFGRAVWKEAWVSVSS